MQLAEPLSLLIPSHALSGICSVFGHRTATVSGARPGSRQTPQRSASLCSPHSTFPSLMARDRSRHCPRRQTQCPRCPSCNKRFSDVLRHLNHRESKCANWFNTTIPRHSSPPHHHGHSTEDLIDPPISDNFSNTQQPPPPSHRQPCVQCVEFPGAAKTFGRMKTFMDRFDDDRYSGFRTTNIYYPFSGKDEWELGSFLLSSGLPMRKINDFLRLKMVISPTPSLATAY